MKKTIIVLLLCLSTTGFAQKFLNLDFEYTSPGSLAPMKWFSGGPGYTVGIDELVKTSKSKSLKIASNNPAKSQFGVCTGYFPVGLVKGKNIEQALQLLFEGTNVKYSINDRHILLFQEGNR